MVCPKCNKECKQIIVKDAVTEKHICVTCGTQYMNSVKQFLRNKWGIKTQKI